MSAARLLEVIDLSVAIGATRIVKNVSLEVRAGEILGLVGASGSGKSMTALGIMRLLPSNASCTGITRLNGETLSVKSEAEMRAIRGRDIGMVFQEPMSALNPLMRIGDQVAETVRSHRQASDRRGARHGARSIGARRDCQESRARSIGCRTNCPAASASAWQSPWRWSCRRSCSSRMNPPRLWMSSPKRRCCCCCRGWSALETWA